MKEPKASPCTRRVLLKRAAAASLAERAVTAANTCMAQGEPAVKNLQPLTNDTAKLKPRTAFDVPVLEFDFPSLQIGVAAYQEGPTGCTVFRFANDPTSVIDVRGGFPGTVHGSSEEDVRTAAICFAGGSTYGVEAADGVAAELFALSGYSDLKLVRGAIIWDFWRDNKIYPDKELGRAALKSARTGIFPLGRAGVGCSAGCAGEGTGQGGAFRQVGSTKIAVFTVVNASGVIVNREGQVVRGNLDPKTGQRHHFRELLERKLANNEATEPPMGKNTTLTLVVTNQQFTGYFETRWQLRQLARQVHSSMARAIQPFHSMSDGDVLFAVTTNEVENKLLNLTDLGVLASELAWDAVLNCFVRKDALDRK
jgi:L-aminopeptidase/D-esterase-like protein